MGRRAELAQPAVGADGARARQAAPRAYGRGPVAGARLAYGDVVDVGAGAVDRGARGGAAARGRAARHHRQQLRRGYRAAPAEQRLAVRGVLRAAESYERDHVDETAAGAGGWLARLRGRSVEQFPRANHHAFKLALGGAHFLSFVGPLQEWSTARSYGPKVQDWMQFNWLGGYDWREVIDSKVCAFAGWLADPAGRGSSDKCFNGWTSALNDYFDKSFGLRPFLGHTIKRLKKRYHDKQLARTLGALVVGRSRVPEPKEARLGLTAVGFMVMLDDARAGSGRPRWRIASLFVLAVFLLRPNTVQGFQTGDVVLLRARRAICILVRQVKRWPELRLAPAPREVICGAAGTPLGEVFDVLLAAEAENPRWYLALAQSATADSAGTVASKWVQDVCDVGRVPRPEGRNFTAYSLRIAIASTMFAYRMDERWIQAWGYWRSQDQYKSYVREHFGRQPFLAGLVSFGFALQDGRPYDFTIPGLRAGDQQPSGIGTRVQR